MRGTRLVARRMKWSEVGGRGAAAGSMLTMSERDPRELLTGEYDHVIDEKGRIKLPAPLRNLMLKRDGDVVLTKQPGGGIGIWPGVSYLARSRALQRLPVERRDKAARAFFGATYRTIVDAEARILLPVRLRAYARLERDIVIVGVGDHLEVWDRGAYGE